MFFVWLIFTAVCLCLYCCVLHVRMRVACLLTYEATFQYPVFVFFGIVPLSAWHPCLRRLHSRGFFSAISVPHVTHVMSVCAGVTRQFLLRLHNRASATTLLCIQLVCTCASRTPFPKPCLCAEKPQFRACIRCSSVPPVPAFGFLRGHTGYDSSCPWCQTPSARGCGGCYSSCLCFYMPVRPESLKLWLSDLCH